MVHVSADDEKAMTKHVLKFVMDVSRKRYTPAPAKGRKDRSMSKKLAGSALECGVMRASTRVTHLIMQMTKSPHKPIL